MRDDVGIANQHLVVWEGPVALSAARIVVVNEGDSVLWHPADETWWFSVRILEPPILGVPTSFLEDALRCEVEGCRPLVGRVDPIAEILPMLVLIVAKAAVVIAHVTPEFTYSPGRLALVAVVPNKLGSVTFHKVEPPGLEAHLQTKPPEPDANALLHLLIPMINIWSCGKLAIPAAWAMFPGAVRVRVAERDCPATPVHDSSKARPGGHSSGELIPLSVASFLVATSVVDHDVSHAANSNFFQLLQAGLQRSLRSVFGVVKVEKLRGKIALRRHGGGAGREPDVGEAHVSQHVRFSGDHAIPIAGTSSPALPVEALEHKGLGKIRVVRNLLHPLQQSAALHPPLHLVQPLSLLQRLDLFQLRVTFLMHVVEVDKHHAGGPAQFRVQHAIAIHAEMPALPSIHPSIYASERAVVVATHLG
mmetsp:Transcript_76650/g.138298  ORF Transcript_76650/g.138298 Transcript_76650/m.138298 type:complete len:420 (+) Transcript_76650:310-1569(+)